MRRNAAAAWVIDLLLALRPVWWVARGWAMYAMIAPVFGIGFLTAYTYGPTSNVIGLALLAAFVVLSVQWGRGQWSPNRWVRRLRIVLSIIVAIALPFLTFSAVESLRNQYTEADWVPDYTVPGLAVDGERVRNIFAYDSEGKPLSDVQLFDQNGQPLTTVGGMGDPAAEWDYYFEGGGGPVPLPWTTPGRTPVWNVFPLREAVPSYEGDGTTDVSDAEVPDFPFAQVPAVGGTSNPSPSASTSTSTTPSATPDISPAPAP